jgi:hypothetical protein
MSADFVDLDESDTEALLAELTEAAYRVALQQGIKGPFLDLELQLWRELRRVLARQAEALSCPV